MSFGMLMINYLAYEFPCLAELCAQQITGPDFGQECYSFFLLDEFRSDKGLTQMRTIQRTPCIAQIRFLGVLTNY